MRNLKKFLALVLAMMMAFSLMVTVNAASSNFSAGVDDKFVEAVEVLNGMGVFKGRAEDGQFHPGDPIKRSEVAAILYRVMTADVNDRQADIYKDYGRFIDVTEDAWYAGYINLMYDWDLIKGYSARGDGTDEFGPNDYVTGYQVLVMFLRAMGYGKQGEFEEANWKFYAASLASQERITRNIDEGTLGQYATREQVAEMIFRAIQRPTVTWTQLGGYSDKQNSLGLGNNFNDSLGVKNFGLDWTESYIVGNQDTGEDYTILGFKGDGSKMYRSAGNTNNKSFNLESSILEFGHQTKVWYHNRSLADGAYQTVYAAFDKAENSALEKSKVSNGTTYKQADYISFSEEYDDFDNGGTGPAYGSLKDYSIVVNNEDGTKAIIGLYYRVDQYTAIDNYASPKTATFEKANTGSAVNQVGVIGLEDLTLGQFVDLIGVKGTAGAPTLGTSATADGNYYAYYVTPLDSAIGSVTKNNTSTNVITFNGEDYAKTISDVTSNLPTALPGSPSWTAGVTYRLYLDIMGNWVSALPANSNVYLMATYGYFMTDNAGGSVKYYVQGVDDQGNTQTYELADDSEYEALNATGVAYLMFDGTAGSSTTRVVAPRPSWGASETSLILSPSTNGNGTYTVAEAKNTNGDADEPAVLAKTGSGIGKAYPEIDSKTNISTINGSSNAQVRKSTAAIGSSSNYFFNNSTKFIFVTGFGSTLKVEIKTGLNELVGDYPSYTLPKEAILTYHDSYVAAIGTTNYVIDTVLVRGAYAPDSNTNLVYIPDTNYSTVQTYRSATVTSTLTDVAGNYYFDAYFNGVEGTVIQSGSTVTGNSFYTYSVDANGIYTLNDVITTVPNTTYGVNFGQVTKAAGTSADYVLVNGTQYKIAPNAIIVNETGSTSNKNFPTTAYDLVVAAENHTIYAAVEIVDSAITVVYVTDYT